MTYEEQVKRQMEQEAARLPECPVNENIDGGFAINRAAGKAALKFNMKKGRNLKARRLSRKKS